MLQRKTVQIHGFPIGREAKLQDGAAASMRKEPFSAWDAALRLGIAIALEASSPASVSIRSYRARAALHCCTEAACGQIPPSKCRDVSGRVNFCEHACAGRVAGL